MIQVSVLYPNTEGGKFDVDYYCHTHMRMVKKALGAALRGVSVESGLSGGSPGSAAAYVASGHLLFDSLEAFQTAIAPHNTSFMADLPNYTDIRPIIQVSEVRLWEMES